MQTFVYIAFSLFLCFTAVTIVLIVKLLTNHTILIKIRAKLQDQTANLEVKVDQRTEELNKTIRELEDSESRHLAIINNASAGIGMLNYEGEILQCNHRWAQMLGYEIGDFNNRPFWDLFSPDDISQKRDKFQQLLQGGIDHYHFESRSIRKDGTVFWGDVSITPVITDNGNAESAIFIIADITERKNAEMKIRELSKQMVNAGEFERQKISRDLHDEIVQTVIGLKMSIETLLDDLGQVDEKLQDKISNLSTISGDLIQNIRDLSHDLNPTGLEEMGLEFAVSQFLKEVTNPHDLKIEFKTIGLDNIILDFNTRINLFRIIQEAVNNIKSHAKASRIKIKILVSNSNIDLRIEDDGIGFDVKQRSVQAISEKRMGLSNIKSRVKLLSGTFDIVSEVNNGTTISIEIPFKED